MAEYRRAYSGLTKTERVRLTTQLRKRGYKYRTRQDPNGKYEIWLLRGRQEVMGEEGIKIIKGTKSYGMGLFSVEMTHRLMHKFVDPSELTTEQLTDPDYRIKQIARDTGMSEQELVVCSKCHHCR